MSKTLRGDELGIQVAPLLGMVEILSAGNSLAVESNVVPFYPIPGIFLQQLVEVHCVNAKGFGKFPLECHGC